MEKSILQVVHYFEVFGYPPTVTELNLFLNRKSPVIHLKQELHHLVERRRIYTKSDRIAMNKKIFKDYEAKRKRSIRYFRKVSSMLSWTTQIPFIQFVGVSGSLSMLNMTKNGDIDIFVIADSQTIWTIRFILLVYKHFLKLKNPDIGNKLCFNLFFDETGLEIAKNKRNEYIGHEVLQVKSIINKNNTYERFLRKNTWILNFFPNVQLNLKDMKASKKLSRQPFYLIFTEEILKKLQVWWLDRKNIKWDYHKGQLWLIQDDFEKKIKSTI